MIGLIHNSNKDIILTKSITNLDVYIGAKVRELRLKHKVTLKEITKTLNVSNQQLMRYEVGIHRVTASKLIILAKLFNVSVYQFVPEEYRHVDKSRKKKKQVERKKDDS